MNDKNYWYKTTTDYCPLCGKETVTKERIYGEKPKDALSRYAVNEIYDYCDAF